eukprot:TRINITY_DN45227_c0_g1_i1.p1 TRINITY_DN45227_c0_g1~~TRINITY_DN45227_c0_g1_i1.p1  ORF type:complete len:175 (-),score=30.60 TRINITY_DN45227_c0_g1_i1:545-1069(-)
MSRCHRSRSPNGRSTQRDVYCLDVECVATGISHELSSRSPCAVALVDSAGCEVFKTLIKPAQKIVSYLTPITGLTASDLQNGMSLEDAVKKLKEVLPKDATLVGQNIESDVAWMNLTRGVDYAQHVDIAQFFKGYNARYGTYSVHSLQHEASVLLGKSPPTCAHDPVWDAKSVS